MALRVWLPLNGNLENKGISDIVPELMGAGITYGAGKIGQAATFPNNCNSCIHMPGLKLQTGSWCAWIKITGEGSGTSQRILSEGRDTGSIGTNIWVTKDGATLYCTSHKKQLQATAGTGVWFHIALTFGDGKMTLYKNGTIWSSTTYTEDSDYAQSNDRFVLGKMSYSYTNASNYFPFNGQLNDVRIYDHCLSPLEVKEISQGLVLHYKLDGFNGGAGENLISNTKTFTSVTGGNTTLTTESYNGAIIRNYNQTVTANKEILYYNNLLYPELGATYTLSFWAKGSGVITTYFYGASGYLQVASVKNSGGYNGTGTDGNNTLTLSSDWKRYWITWTLKTTGDVTIYKHLLFRHIYSSSNATVQIDIAGLKLEKNAVATSWSPTASEMGIDITKVKDSSGYEYNGEIGGTLTPSSDSPRYNICSYFGTNNYIKIPTREIFVRDALTWSAWAYYDDWSTFGGRIASCTESGGHSMGYRNGTTFYTAYVGTGESSNTYKTQSVNVSTLTSGWHMFSFTYDGLALKSYIDGVEVKSTTCYSTKTSLYYNNSALMFLGAEANTATASDKNFNGKISDFRIYATALSAEDILDLYHTPANIDNLGGIHGFEFVESQNQISIKQNGLVLNKELDEMNFDTNAQFMKETKNIVARNIIEK